MQIAAGISTLPQNKLHIWPAYKLIDALTLDECILESVQLLAVTVDTECWVPAVYEHVDSKHYPACTN